jgi:hypothetical protein
MSGPYTATLLEHFRRPRNFGSLPQPDAAHEVLNSVCGDRIRMEIAVEQGAIDDAQVLAALQRCCRWRHCGAVCRAVPMTVPHPVPLRKAGHAAAVGDMPCRVPDYRVNWKCCLRSSREIDLLPCLKLNGACRWTPPTPGAVRHPRPRLCEAGACRAGGQGRGEGGLPGDAASIPGTGMLQPCMGPSRAELTSVRNTAAPDVLLARCSCSVGYRVKR